MAGYGGPLGLSMRFTVKVDTLDLGSWSSCRGLDVTFKSERIREGGSYQYQTILPEYVEYSMITLQRAMSSTESQKVQSWLQDISQKWIGGLGDFQDNPGSPASITLLDASNKEVITWHLRRVFPYQWKGPDLDSQKSAVAIETLQLVHEGFLE